MACAFVCLCVYSFLSLRRMVSLKVVIAHGLDRRPMREKDIYVYRYVYVYDFSRDKYAYARTRLLSRLETRRDSVEPVGRLLLSLNRVIAETRVRR